MQEFKDAGGGNEEALFSYSCSWLFCEMVGFFQYSFRTASISEFQEALDARIKTVFFKAVFGKKCSEL